MPRVYGKVLRLPPAIVVVSLLVGGTLLGIVGALLALPIAAGLQMVVRELRVELPGETPPDATTRARDERAEHIYEQLVEGATAADAGVIAGELAQKLRQNERTGATLTGELPAIDPDRPDGPDGPDEPDGRRPAAIPLAASPTDPAADPEPPEPRNRNTGA